MKKALLIAALLLPSLGFAQAPSNYIEVTECYLPNETPDTVRVYSSNLLEFAGTLYILDNAQRIVRGPANGLRVAVEYFSPDGTVIQKSITGSFATFADAIVCQRAIADALVSI